MHPIERLRYVARSGGIDQGLLVRETAGALVSLGFDPAGLVTSCRRILARHPTAGALWSLSARVLTAADPMAEAWKAAENIEDDPTRKELAAHLPDDSSVLVVGWPDLVSLALIRRGDIEAWVVDAYGEGAGLVRQLDSYDVECVEVPMSGIGAAAAEADIVLLEASAAGPDHFLAPSGSLAAAAVGYCLGGEVWLVAGEGRVLPPSLWDALVASLDPGDPWESDDELVPMSLVTTVVGPSGRHPAAELKARVDCPAAPELWRPAR
jgi:hypothetical protein